MIATKKPLFLSLRKTAQRAFKTQEYTGNSMGILIDATNSIYRKREKDYVTELKIIDETLNEHEVYGVMIKCCTIYIFSQEDFGVTYCNKIGQIVYLDKFTFSVWHNIKLETKYLSRTENLICFEEGSDGIKKVGSIKKDHEDIDETISKRALMLNKWFQDYFFNMHKPILGVSLINNYTLMAQPFSLIFKYLQYEERGQMEINKVQEEGEQQTFHFEDSNSNRFWLKKSTLKYSPPQSQYMLFRGVNFIGNFFEINMIQTGKLLGLPPQFAPNYEEAMNYCAVSRFNDRFLHRSHRQCPLSRMTAVIPKTKTSVIELIKQLDLYENRRSKKDQVRVEERYMIEAVAINYQGSLQMFHTDYQIIIDESYIESLTDDERKELIDQDRISYLFEGTIGVIDRSSESTGKIFNVHLFSNEKRTYFYDSEMIDLLVKKSSIDLTKSEEKKVKAKIDSILQNLMKKSSFSNPISMLVEPIRAETLVFRLTNTIFE